MGEAQKWDWGPQWTKMIEQCGEFYDGGDRASYPWGDTGPKHNEKKEKDDD